MTVLYNVHPTDLQAICLHGIEFNVIEPQNAIHLETLLPLLLDKFIKHHRLSF